MTITEAPSTAIALPDDDIGLGDMEQSDLQIPRMKLIGKEAVFEDSLTKEKFSSIDVALLGLVKQRILWEPEIQNNAKPLCRSLDNVTGTPNTDPKWSFPWNSPTTAALDKDLVLAAGHINCADCPLKEWGSHPNNDKPWCTQQLVISAMVQVVDPANGDVVGWSPTILTFQGASIKPTNAYLTYFKQRNLAPFTVVTHIRLKAMKRGQTDYAIPEFTKGDATDQSWWGYFNTNQKTIRSFLQTPRSVEEAETSVAPAATQQPNARPLPDDEEPF